MSKEKHSILQTLDEPSHIRSLTCEQLEMLASEVREMIIRVVSRNGGHLAPSLGVVDLTIALMSVFDFEQDRIIWDVGHQAYAYKILTGRRKQFHTLRRLDGISGFPRIDESSFDHFGVGHSSTSISAGLGMAVARDILKEKNRVLAVIGDGSMTAGLAYEGLNQAGGLDRDLVVILNDNEMSISRNVGALSSFLSRKLSSRWMIRFKKEFESWMRHIPRVGDELLNYARRSEGSLKGLFTPGILFEAFKFNYIGPVDGHSISSLVQVFNQLKELEGPILVHVLTKKGKGYGPAEDNPSHYHGVGCFEPETGLAKKKGQCLPTFTEIFGRTLCSLAEKDQRIVAITAAMPEGTGLVEFGEKFPDRFFDVGICEQHAVTFAAGMAVRGFKPFVAVYSTFLQRSYDQVVHDVCLQNLPVTFCLDRGGIVGEDGATHHGVFDFSFLRHIPNMVCMAPKDEAELQSMLMTAADHPGPVSIRYPRGVGVGVDLKDNPDPVPVGQGEMVRDGEHGLIMAAGSRLYPALEAALEIEKEGGLSLAVFNPRFIKPVPEEMIRELVNRFKKIMIIEENVLAGGFSSAVLEFLTDRELLSGLKIKRMGIPDVFVEHGTQKELRQMLGLCKGGIKKTASDFFRDEPQSTGAR